MYQMTRRRWLENEARDGMEALMLLKALQIMALCVYMNALMLNWAGNQCMVSVNLSAVSVGASAAFGYE